MKDVMKYEEFIGSVHYSAEDETFYGKLEGIDDLVIFEGVSVKELNFAFKEAVEDYKDLCKLAGKQVKKSYKGSFNIRINTITIPLCNFRCHCFCFLCRC